MCKSFGGFENVCHTQGRSEDSGVPGEKERWGLLRAKRAENFQGRGSNYEKLLLVYFMRLPDLEAMGVRPLGPWGPGALYLLPPSPWPRLYLTSQLHSITGILNKWGVCHLWRVWSHAVACSKYTQRQKKTEKARRNVKITKISENNKNQWK